MASQPQQKPLVSHMFDNYRLPSDPLSLPLVQVAPEGGLRYVKGVNLPKGRTPPLFVNSPLPLFGAPFLS